MSELSPVLIIVIVITLFFGLILWGWPQYNVYSLEMDGMAELKQAEWSKQILIEEAKAKEEAALLQAQAKVTLAEAEGKADIVRAEAAAEANRIIGESLKGNSDYLRYVWIKTMQESTSEKIYIPTEAGLPILEARPKN